MLFAVVKLHKQGVRLTRTEIQTQKRAVGDLRFCAPPQSTDPAKPRDPLKRPTRVAELVGEPIGQVEHTLIRSLLDPVVVNISSVGLVIVGYEMESFEIDGAQRLVEYTQGWLVRHVTDGERRMRRGDVPM